MTLKGIRIRTSILFWQIIGNLRGNTRYLDEIDWAQFPQYLKTYEYRLKKRLLDQGFSEEDMKPILERIWQIKRFAQKDQPYIFLDTEPSKVPDYLCLEYINEFINKFNLTLVGQRKYTTRIPGYFKILNIV